MLLPGSEAQQLAVYIGWLLHNIRGGIVAGALFVIPSMFILFGLSYVYAAYEGWGGSRPFDGGLAHGDRLRRGDPHRPEVAQEHRHDRHRGRLLRLHFFPQGPVFR